MSSGDVYSNNLPASPQFQVRQCTRETCGLRFTMEANDPRGARCPVCRAPTMPAGEGYDRLSVPPSTGKPSGPELEVLLDNIRSAWNVGSMLRASDGAGVRHVHLCGVSATPENPKVWKTALGAEKHLPWTFHPDGVKAARSLRDAGYRLWALEGGNRAESLFDIAEVESSPVMLVAGNELTGVDPGILEICERVVCLPMLGTKGSLNVAVAFGIAAYTIRFGMLATCEEQSPGG